MTTSGWILAIDFGTTNTAAAVRSASGDTREVRLSAEADQMPSCVYAEADGRLVGQAAARQALVTPERFERNPKTRLGEGVVQLAGVDYSSVDLIAAVLRSAAGRAASTAGRIPPARVVLTHPDDWRGRRRGELEAAAARAGLGSVQLLPEPVAAACWYLRSARLSAGQMIAVFDFGGGTCDVALLRATGNAADPFTIEQVDGEDQLGGEHIDNQLMDWVLEQLTAMGEGAAAEQLGKPDQQAAWLTLRDQVRGAKHTLSEYPSAHIGVRVGSTAVSLQLTIGEFDNLVAPDVDRAVAVLQRVLERAGLTPSDLYNCYLTGGSSHISLVHRRLTGLLDRPPATLDDPKLVTALGAAHFTQPPPVPVDGSTTSRSSWWKMKWKQSPRRRTGLMIGLTALGSILVALVSLGVYGTSRPWVLTSTASAPADMVAIFPDLNRASGVSCSPYQFGRDEFVDNQGVQANFIMRCIYSSEPDATVYYLRWPDLAAGPRWIGDLRARFKEVEQYTTWTAINGGATQGPYFAGQFGQPDNIALCSAYYRVPYSFTVQASTLEAANRLYSIVSKTSH